MAILDIAMPHADGYEVARRLRALPEIGPNLKVVALTGFARPSDYEKSVAARFSHHFVKPVEPDELDAVLSRLIGDL